MRINKYWNFLSLFLALGLLGTACKTTKSEGAQKAAEKVTDEKLADALLWKIDGKGLAEHSYLYGTIHLIDKESFFWPEGTLAAFEDSERATFEVDLNDMFDVGKQMGLMTKAFMKDNKTLKDLYTAEEYAIVESHFSELGLPMMMLEKLKPMFLTVFASGDLEMGKGLGDQSSIKSYEMEFFELAKDSKKEIKGLESLEFQVSVFDSIPYEAQADMLLETINSADTEDDAFQEMIQMYIDQRVGDMVSYMSEEEEGIQGYEDLLLYGRNKKWIPIMEEQMKEKQTFFAVGAGHLGGKDGVIDLLQRAGYTLTPLSHKKGS